MQVRDLIEKMTSDNVLAVYGGYEQKYIKLEFYSQEQVHELYCSYILHYVLKCRFVNFFDK